jgi:hypothetical protein
MSIAPPRGLFLCALILSSSPVHAQVFHDDFDGTSLDLTKWALGGGGTVSVAGGVATLSAGCGQFPYITSKMNPFPVTGDFLVRVGFRYPSPAQGGNGFGATDSWNNPYPLRAFGVWQDFCCGGFRAYYGDGGTVFLASAPETAYHVFEWRYSGGIYEMYVDDVLQGSGASHFRPTGIFLGHPPYDYCPWTTSEVDFVHIEFIGTTPTRSAPWGRLKVLYR